VRHATQTHAEDHAALALVDAGYAVLPLWGVRADGTCACGDPHERRPRDRGKHPLGALAEHGYKSASRDPRTVEAWWRDSRAANVAVATGDGFVIVDVDRRNGGHVVLAALEARYGALPRDAGVLTAGGEHVYLACTTAERTRGLGDGLELLAARKYAVAPPSVTYGTYCWRHAELVAVTDLPPAPAWLLNLRPEREARPRDEQGDSRPLRLPRWVPARIRVGERHTMLARVGGWLRGAGYAESDILLTLLRVRDERCDHASDIIDADVTRLARYIITKPAGSRRDVRAEFERIAATWTDRNAARDRRVRVAAVAVLVNQQQQPERVHLATRSIAKLARMSPRTASHALLSLAARSVLQVARVARPGDDEAAEFIVSLLPTSSGGGGEE
jgi:Bifunctional DNA primase/polymerase, N-terminal